LEFDAAQFDAFGNLEFDAAQFVPLGNLMPSAIWNSKIV